MRPICAPRRQQVSDEGRRKKARLYRLFIVTGYYVSDQRMVVDEDENGGIYRNQQMATTKRDTGRGPRSQQLPFPACFLPNHGFLVF